MLPKIISHHRGLKKSPRKSPCKRVAVGRFTRPSLQSISKSVEMATQAKARIKVVVRVRPQSEREMDRNERIVVQVIDRQMLVFDPKDGNDDFYYHGMRQKGRDLLRRPHKDIKFAFDHVFGEEDTNLTIFQGTTKDVVQALLDGYNCSVFAYGATGAGKTYTMLGSEENPGLTFHTVQELFNRLEQNKMEDSYEVSVTYLEVYNETIRDLLVSNNVQLPIREDGKCSVTVPGLTYHKPTSAQELLAMLAAGNQSRTQHPTDHNAESSRSHAVFQVYIRLRSKADGLTAKVRSAKLSMIDLAGSERGSATGFEGMRFREGSSINRSLLALGNCINALADGRKHIPYRNSKLTRLLKDSLGGNCRTVMIANVSPSNSFFDDIYNTLKYADRAKNIKINLKKNVVSVDFHVTKYAQIVEEMQNEIADLKDKLKNYETKEVAWEEERDIKNAKLREGRSAEAVSVNAEELSLHDKLREFFTKRENIRRRLLSVERKEKELLFKIKIKQGHLDTVSKVAWTVDDKQKSEEKIYRQLRNLESRCDKIGKRKEDLLTEVKSNDEFLTVLLSEAEMLTKDVNVALPIETNFLCREIHHSQLKVELQDCHIQEDHMRRMALLQEQEKYKMNNLLNKTFDVLKECYLQLMKTDSSFMPKLNIKIAELIASAEGGKEVCWAEKIESSETSPINPKSLSSTDDLYSLLNLTLLQETTINSPQFLPNGVPWANNNSGSNTLVNGTEDIGPRIKFSPPSPITMSILTKMNTPTRIESVSSPNNTIMQPDIHPFMNISLNMSSLPTFRCNMTAAPTPPRSESSRYNEIDNGSSPILTKTEHHNSLESESLLLTPENETVSLSPLPSDAYPLISKSPIPVAPPRLSIIPESPDDTFIVYSPTQEPTDLTSPGVAPTDAPSPKVVAIPNPVDTTYSIIENEDENDNVESFTNCASDEQKCELSVEVNECGESEHVINTPECELSGLESKIDHVTSESQISNILTPMEPRPYIVRPTLTFAQVVQSPAVARFKPALLDKENTPPPSHRNGQIFNMNPRPQSALPTKSFFPRPRSGRTAPGSQQQAPPCNSSAPSQSQLPLPRLYGPHQHNKPHYTEDNRPPWSSTGNGFRGRLVTPSFTRVRTANPHTSNYNGGFISQQYNNGPPGYNTSGRGYFQHNQKPRH